MSKNSDTKVFDWPLTGKLITAVDPVLLKKGDFQTLRNFRYTNNGVIGVSGMTKINSSLPGTNMTRVEQGFYFHKDSPTEENHILAQYRSSNGAITTTTVYKSNNTSLAIPGTTEFASFSTVNNTYKVKFSSAPDSCVVFTDREKNWIWGGNEARTAAFIMGDLDKTDEYDRTELINRWGDSNNAVTFPQYTSGNDSNAVLLLHCNGSNNSTTITDSSGRHTVTSNNSTLGVPTQIDTSTKVFGTGCLLHQGSWATVTGNLTDFYFTGNFTFDFRVRFDSLPSSGDYYMIWTQWLDSSRAVFFGVYNNSGVYEFRYYHYPTAGNLTISHTVSWTPSLATWYHLALVKAGTYYSLYINGNRTGNTTVNGNAQGNFSTGNTWIGTYGGPDHEFWGRLDEFRVSNVARWTRNFDIPTSEYSTNNSSYAWIGTVRPANGFHFDLATKNNNTSGNLTIQYYNNGTWTSVGNQNNANVTANSSVFGQSGNVTFDTTVGNATLGYMYGRYLYWYQLTMNNMYANTSVYKITTSMPVQAVGDIWDGVDRKISYMMRERSSSPNDLEDLSYKIQSDYIDISDNGTFYELHGFASNQALVFGSLERLSGIKLKIYSSANTSNNMTVQYWNGGNWTNVSGMDDGTSSIGVSLSMSGAITWSVDANVTNNESRKTLNATPTVVNPLTYEQWVTTSGGLTGGPWISVVNQLTSTIQQQNYNQYLSTYTPPDTAPIYGPQSAYYYRMYWGASLSGTGSHIYLYYATGIPAPKTVLPFDVPVLWNKSLCLGNERQGYKNKIIISSPDTSCVWNGSTSGEIYVGDSKEIVGMETMFMREYGLATDSLVVFKKDSVHLVSGSAGAGYQTVVMSNTVGLAAPHTLVRCESGIEDMKAKRCVLIWQASHGIVSFDGVTLETISDDIKNYFDPNDPDYMADPSNSTAFYDRHRGEYHLLFTSANGSRPDTELVYDRSAKKWFEVDRDGKDLRCGFSLTANNGTHYCYGGGNAGYVYRLENNNTFDGNNITHKFRLGDIPMAGSMMYETELRKLKLTAVSKANETNTVSVSVYTDGKSTAADPGITAVSQNNNNRYYHELRSCTIKGITHSMEFTLINNNETYGFEPLLVSGSYRTVREE